MKTLSAIIVPICFALGLTAWPKMQALALEPTSPAIKVEGASEKTLLRLQSKIATAAYGANRESAPSRPVASEESQKPCDAFYMPRARLQVFKQQPAVDPCLNYGTRLLADTETRILYLCKEGRRVQDYDFSMGSGGVGKREEGDHKTPLGTYPLAKPLINKKFGTFLYVAFPTAEQKRRGLTGSEIGVHGPVRPFRCAGFLNTIVNWTQGCIAVASDAFIQEVAQFSLDNNVKEITILPLESAP